MFARLFFILVSFSIRAATSLPTLDTNEVVHIKNFTLSARELLEPRKSFPASLNLTLLTHLLGQDDWVWWCSPVQSNSPTVNDARVVANYIAGLGEQRCGVDRPPGSSQQVGVGMGTSGTATAVLYFTNNGDTVRGHHVEFSCADTGYWLNKLIDNCQSNGRVLGG
jgi:hypothetical protein